MKQGVLKYFQPYFYKLLLCLAVICLTYFFASFMFSFVALLSDGLHVSILSSNMTSPKWSSSYRSSRMVKSASRVYNNNNRTVHSSITITAVKYDVELYIKTLSVNLPVSFFFPPWSHSYLLQTLRSLAVVANHAGQRNVQSTRSRSETERWPKNKF